MNENNNLGNNINPVVSPDNSVVTPPVETPAAPVSAPVETPIVQTAPVGAPVSSTPVETPVGAPVSSAPVGTPTVQTAPVSVPVSSAPVETPTVQTVPVSAPVASTPVETSTVQTAPVSAPVASTPVETPVVQTTPESTPVETPTVQTAPVDNASTSGTVQIQDINNVSTSTTVSADISTSKKSSSKIIIIIIAVIVVAVLVAGFMFIIGNKGNKTSNKTASEIIKEVEQEEEDTKNEILKNVTYKVEGVIENKGVLISIESTNSDFVGVSIPVNFYDKDNVRIDSSPATFLCLENGQKLYTIVYPSDEFDSYKIDEESINAYKHQTDSDVVKCVNIAGKYKVDITNDDTEKEYYTVLTNNIDKKLNLVGYLLFYKDNKIIDFDYISLSNVEANSSVKETSYYPHDSNYNKITPDKAEFVLSSVYEK